MGPAEEREWLEQALEVHPGLGAARMLLARACLAEGDAAAAAAAAEQALRDDPGSYDAAVALAEARMAGGEAAAALAALDRAAGLDGCQNRVELLRARGWLVRARGLRAAGLDGTSDLDRVLALRGGQAARAADNAPCLELFAEAERERRGT